MGPIEGRSRAQQILFPEVLDDDLAEENPARHIVRLCFSKREETLDAGIAAMAKAKELLG